MESPSCHSKKKRKIDDGYDDDEEAKVEQFFALVRSIRETRSWLINFESGTCKEAENKNKNGVEEEKNKALVWMPTFQLEDFVEDEAQRQNNPNLPLAGASHSKEVANKEEEAEEGIDLRLSL